MAGGYSIFFNPDPTDPDVRPMKDRKGRRIAPIRWDNALAAYGEPYLVALNQVDGLMFHFFPANQRGKIIGIRDFYEARNRGLYPMTPMVLIGRDPDLAHLIFLVEVNPPEAGIKIKTPNKPNGIL